MSSSSPRSQLLPKELIMNISQLSKRGGLSIALLVGAAVAFPIAASAVTITVPGTSSPFLAGMPNGSTDGLGSTAPAQSPVQVTGITITPGTSLTFSTTGVVGNGPGQPLSFNPDGTVGNFASNGSQNGISGYIAPINSLAGVFLPDSLPTSSVAPSALDFSNTGSRSYSSLSPLLQQVFFIGDGLTGTGSGNQQTVVVPTGATRLFLASIDQVTWADNTGQFNVNVQALSQSTSVPEPFTIIGTLVGGTAALRLRKKLKSTST